MSTSISKRLAWPGSTIDPTKRAKSIRDALKSGKIKPSKAIDETLELLDEIVARDIKTA